jgi:hypothetical protein
MIINFWKIKQLVIEKKLPTVYLLLDDIVRVFDFDRTGMLKLREDTLLSLCIDKTKETVIIEIIDTDSAIKLIETNDFIKLHDFIEMFIELQE